MKNKLWIPIIALLLFTSVDSFGQRWKLRRYEIDMYVAATTFHGDIGKANESFANMFNGCVNSCNTRATSLPLRIRWS